MKKKKTTRKKATNTKGVAKLKKITAEAKRIRKASPRMKWPNAVKAAAKKLK